MEVRTSLFLGAIVVWVYCLQGLVGQFTAAPLREKLLENYDRRVRPVRDQNTPVTLDVDVALRQVVDLNELQEVFTTLLWLRLYWTDELLQWNASQYDGLTSTTFHSSEVWRPDIFLINNIGEGSGNLLPVTDVSVSSEGRVAWRQPSMFSSSCKVDVSQFPYDEQVTYYDCCPGPWPSIELHIHLKRRRLFYVVNMVVPCLDLLMLNLAAFYIPPDSGERLGFTITVLLSLVVFQQLLTTQLPATSTSTPLLGGCSTKFRLYKLTLSLLGAYFITGKFFTATIALVTISLLITILVLRLSHPSHPSRPLPRWLHVLILHYMASFFCMCNIAKTRPTSETPRNVNDNWADDDIGTNNLILDSRHQNALNDPKNRSTLQEISSKVENISAYLRGKVNDDEEESEWKMAALVLDRAAMLATAIASVVISLVFLLQ
ncbi:CHRNA7 [Branchiostoma lanceolatum]|uniref:CHRNA7 protein n=1 Tax=Branchiostoma lanceolatum TaxID=7740 RepID=A0A8J9ZGI9_BRALA|nr:CHRNA7 [Branchiostoma lanceolatum]